MGFYPHAAGPFLNPYASSLTRHRQGLCTSRPGLPTREQPSEDSAYLFWFSSVFGGPAPTNFVRTLRASLGEEKGGEVHSCMNVRANLREERGGEVLGVCMNVRGNLREERDGEVLGV